MGALVEESVGVVGLRHELIPVMSTFGDCGCTYCFRPALFGGALKDDNQGASVTDSEGSAECGVASSDGGDVVAHQRVVNGWAYDGVVVPSCEDLICAG